MYFADVSQNAQNGNFRLQNIQSRIIYVSILSFLYFLVAKMNSYS